MYFTKEMPDGKLQIFIYLFILRSIDTVDLDTGRTKI